MTSCFQNSLRRLLNWTIATLLVTCIFVQVSWGSPPIGLEEYLRLDELPCFRESVRVGSVSSYDRTEGNDDGFSGTYSYVRKEGDGLVLADLVGPGVIYRFYTPTPTDDVIEFYFDGEAKPRLRIPFGKIFDGSTPPFLAPLVGSGSGGNWCYLPIPYATSCKIIARAPKVQFYQINFASYAKDTKLKSFSPDAPPYSGPALKEACEMLGRAGQDLSTWTAPPESNAPARKSHRQCCVRSNGQAVRIGPRGPHRRLATRASFSLCRPGPRDRTQNGLGP